MIISRLLCLAAAAAVFWSGHVDAAPDRFQAGQPVTFAKPVAAVLN